MDRASDERASKWIGELARAMGSFAESIKDYPRLLETIVRSTARVCQGSCAINLISPDGQWLESVAVFDEDPEALALVRRLMLAGRVRLDADTPTSRVARSGAPFFAAVVTTEMNHARFPSEAWPLVDRLAIKSLIQVPLRNQARTLGVLTLNRHGDGARPFDPNDRGFFVLLASILPHWRDAMLLVKPDTILRWHREGFRLFWRWRSTPRSKPKPRMDADIIELIGRMARENGLWGAERIRGELLKLRIPVSKRTIQKYIRDARPPSPHRGQPWLTFLRNHTVWPCDFLQVHDAWFRPIFAFFIVDVNTKRVVHLGVTRRPTEQWTAQQLRDATPFGKAPRFIIRDRDGKFGSSFNRVALGAGMRVLKTAIRAPLMNSVCERFLGSVRRECLDHVLILGQRHLLHVLREFAFDYFNGERPHQGIAQQVPIPSERPSYSSNATVLASQVLGGLHNHYRVAA